VLFRSWRATARRHRLPSCPVKSAGAVPGPSRSIARPCTWTVPAAVARQMYFLASRLRTAGDRRPCWDVTGCHEERKLNCPAWEFRSGEICWFVNGTICDGTARKTWDDKMLICRGCKMFTNRV